MKDDFELMSGSGNVFKGFCRPNANANANANAYAEQARDLLAAEIIRVIDKRSLSTREAEKLTGIGHSEFSHIRNARIGRFTLDRMITVLENSIRY